MRLTNKFSVMGRKYDLAYGQANIWKRKLKNDKYELIENAVDKLGHVEDIEEKHNISSLDDLDNRLTAFEIIKDWLNLKVVELLPNNSDTRLFVECGNFKAGISIPPAYIDLFKKVLS